jgi:hypothetical protein
VQYSATSAYEEHRLRIFENRVLRENVKNQDRGIYRRMEKIILSNIVSMKK